MVKDDIIKLLYSKRAFDENIYISMYQLLEFCKNNEVNRIILIINNSKVQTYLLNDQTVYFVTHLTLEALREFYLTLDKDSWIKTSACVQQVISHHIFHQEHKLRIQFFKDLQKDHQHKYSAFNIDIITVEYQIETHSTSVLAQSEGVSSFMNLSLSKSA